VLCVPACAKKKYLSISSIKIVQQEIFFVRKAITWSFWRAGRGFNYLQGKAVSRSDDMTTVDECSRTHRGCWICRGMQECIPRQFIPIHVFSSHNPTLWNWLNTTVCKGGGEIVIEKFVRRFKTKTTKQQQYNNNNNNTVIKCVICKRTQNFSWEMW